MNMKKRYRLRKEIKELISDSFLDIIMILCIVAMILSMMTLKVILFG